MVTNILSLVLISLLCNKYITNGFDMNAINSILTKNIRVFGDIPISDNEFAQRMDAGSRKKLENLIVDYMAKTQVTGASIAVARDREVLYANGFGWASVEEDEKTAIWHKFRVASVSKTVCLVAILKLIEADRLSLDDFVFGEKLLGKLLYRNFTVNARLAKVIITINDTFSLECTRIRVRNTYVPVLIHIRTSIRQTL